MKNSSRIDNPHENKYCIQYPEHSFEYIIGLSEETHKYHVVACLPDHVLYELMAILTIDGEFEDVRRVIKSYHMRRDNDFRAYDP